MPLAIVDAYAEADHVLVLILLIVLRITVVVVQCDIATHHQHQCFLRLGGVYRKQGYPFEATIGTQCHEQRKVDRKSLGKATHRCDAQHRVLVEVVG
uniref:Uncharacterized protein n=1 Tax=Anopheles darlingi TaxID=43151 RepID=A0A2M4D0I9_ANODA